MKPHVGRSPCVTDVRFRVEFSIFNVLKFDVWPVFMQPTRRADPVPRER